MEKLDVYQVARLLKIARRTVYNWMRRGILPPGKKIGGVRRWEAAEIQQALQKIR